MVYSVFFPEVQSSLIETVRIAVLKVPWVVEAYTSGNFPLAAVLTLLINLVLASFVYITLPSIIIPFGGIALGCARAVGWGLILAPTSPELARAMLTHSIVLALEGEGYVIAMFAVYLLCEGRNLAKKDRRRKTIECIPYRNQEDCIHLYTCYIDSSYLGYLRSLRGHIHSSLYLHFRIMS